MTILRHIARRLGAQITETPAPALPRAAGKAGEVSPFLSGQPDAAMSAATPVGTTSRGLNRSGSSVPDPRETKPAGATHPDRMTEQFIRDEERKAR